MSRVNPRVNDMDGFFFGVAVGWLAGWFLSVPFWLWLHR